MNPWVKYTLGRLGLFLAVLLALWPLNLNILFKLMIAILVSAVLGYFLLRNWRDEVTAQVASGVERRRVERERLLAALDNPAGTETDAGTGAETDAGTGAETDAGIGAETNAGTDTGGTDTGGTDTGGTDTGSDRRDDDRDSDAGPEDGERQEKR